MDSTSTSFSGFGLIKIAGVYEVPTFSINTGTYGSGDAIGVTSILPAAISGGTFEGCDIGLECPATISGGTFDGGQLYGYGYPISITGGNWSGSWTFGLGGIGGTYNPDMAALSFSGTGMAYVAAAATATVASGAVTGITVTDGASGYSAAPAVSIEGGGGGGATATATVASGVVTGIAVTNAGSGYTSAPSVVMAYSLTGTLTGGGSLAIVTTLDDTNGLNTQSAQVTSASVTFSG